jgi:uncharacterized protein (DUF1810 family)
MDDPFALLRFVEAQDAGGTYGRAVAELRNGRKVSHWMWYVFPQLAGLGSSPASQYYGITGLAEARAYLTHPVLGSRLLECAGVLVDLPGNDAVQVFGSLDAQKLRSSMTLFALADSEVSACRRVLETFFEGQLDEATVSRV